MSPLPHFANGDPLGAAEANLIARQGVITVETTLDRNDLPAPHDGMTVFVEAANTYYGRVGGEWVVLWSDTGWQSITPSSGFAANYIDIRRIGKLVVLRINSLTRTSGSGPATAFVIPPGFRPTEEHYPAWSSPSPNHTTWITTGGELRGNFTTTGNTYRATTVYPVA